MKTLKRFIKPSLLLACLLLTLVIVANLVVVKKSQDYLYSRVADVPVCYTAIILGAKVSSAGVPSDFLQDRLDAGLELYNEKKVERFLLSGDHGNTNYDEVNSMKKYLISHGVDSSDIFLDHAGFDTYNTMVRAKSIFQVSDVIIVSQQFHISRAVYIARSKGLNAYGLAADKRVYASIKNLTVREWLARVKAFGEVTINKNPVFGGQPIPITGDSQLSFD